MSLQQQRYLDPNFFSQGEIQVDTSRVYSGNLTYDRFYNPNDSDSARVLVLLAGGNFIVDNSLLMHEVAQTYAQYGYQCYVMRYTLSEPCLGYELCRDDLKIFETYLFNNSDSLQIDETRIAAIGTSAGGICVIAGGYTGTSNFNMIVSVSGTGYSWAFDLTEEFNSGEPKLALLHAFDDYLVPWVWADSTYQAGLNKLDDISNKWITGKIHGIPLIVNNYSQLASFLFNKMN